MWRDLRFALRTLKRQPVFAAVIALTLALGIGGSTALFSVVNAVLLRDLPYPDDHQIFHVRTVTPDGSPTGPITPREMRPFYDTDDHLVVEAAAIVWSQEVQVVDAGGRPHATSRYGVSHRFFEVFRPRMVLGRAFERNDPVGRIVIAHGLWRDQFGSDPDIVGRTILAEGRSLQVAGVTAPEFEFPEDPGYWYLMNLGTAYDAIRGFQCFVRLRPGVPPAVFQSELVRLSAELGPDPETNQPPVFVAQPMLHYVVGDLRTTVRILFGAAGILLLIAAINATNLLLSRAASRAREMALREAVGATRWRVLVQLVTESLVITLLGGALGVAAAVAGVRVLLRMAPPDLPRLDTVTVDATVLLFAIGVTLLTGIAVGLAPAWRLLRNPLRTLVNEEGRGTPGGTGRHRLFGGLVGVEIALAVLMVIGAGLLVRSYANLSASHPGVNPERVLTFFMNVPLPYEVIVPVFRDLQERVGALPGVTSVAATSSLPLAWKQYDQMVVFELPGGSGWSDGDAALSARTRQVSAGFFETMGVRRVAGRGLLPSDRGNTPSVAVVNEAFAERFLGGRPVGQRVRYPENIWVAGQVGYQLMRSLVDEAEIVGVVSDVKYMAPGEPAEPAIYFSTEQWTPRRQTVVVRTALDHPETLVAAIRREIDDIDPQLSADFALYETLVRASLARDRLGATLMSVFGLVAVLLAAVGVYGLMSYSVSQRLGELAVRSAIGASSRQILGLVLRRGIRLALAGIAGGMLAAVALRQALASHLYGVTPLDARVFALAALLLFGVATLACFVPAMRATRVQPVDVLRTE